MSDNKYELNDLVTASIRQEPLEFQNAFNDLVIDRIRNAVENKKVEIAQQMYNYEPPEDIETDENDDEFGAGETELENSEEESDG